MTGLKIEAGAEILCCPNCGGSLEFREQQVVCASGHEFRIVGGWPVLIDYEHSVLREDELLALNAASVLERSTSRWRRRAKRGLGILQGSSAPRIHRFLGTLDASDRLLIVGGGVNDHGLSSAYYQRSMGIVGIDLFGSPLVDYIADAHHLPFLDETFDAVVIQAVLEHVLDPKQVVAELWRVLVPNGSIFAETAFLQPVHEGPYDFERFTPSGHRWLFRNFEEIESGPIGGPFAAVGLATAQALGSLFRSPRVRTVAKVAMAPLLVLDRLVSIEAKHDSATGVYFLGRKATAPLGTSEARAIYRGAQR